MLLFILFMSSFYQTNSLSRTSSGASEHSSRDLKNARIVGGKKAAPGRYPYMVALVDSTGQFCGGSLIDSRWVISAAHCAGTATHIEIGRHDISDSSKRYERIKVVEEIIHPNFNKCTLDNDLMMVMLRSSSSYSPVSLYSSSELPSGGQDVTVMGWGLTSENGSYSDVLREVKLEIVSNSKCNDAYGSGEITENMFCASRSGKDACQGDSGGPIIFKGDDASSDSLVGIVSWGNGCADPNYPGVFAKLDFDFINNVKNGPSRHLRLLDKFNLRWDDYYIGMDDDFFGGDDYYIGMDDDFFGGDDDDDIGLDDYYFGGIGDECRPGNKSDSFMQLSFLLRALTNFIYAIFRYISDVISD